jgi:16S rRNA (adenine1518-N6/adenine1519-N6)-dimethyltransferase
MFRPPRKRLGQHFLSDPRILGRIADAVGIVPGDTVVEIGPGRGALTDALLERVGTGGRVVAIEIDRDLAAMLRTQFAERREFTLVQGDVLGVNIASLVRDAWLLVGNIPYNITTPIIFHALAAPRATRMVFLVQREVAARLAARPGGRAYGALSVNVQALADVEVLQRVRAGAFTPPPRVESAVVRLTPRALPEVLPREEAPFRALVQGLFSQRRKQMVRAVRDACGLDAQRAASVLAAAGIPAAVRPEVLAPAEFARLLRVLAPAEFARLLRVPEARGGR